MTDEKGKTMTDPKEVKLYEGKDVAKKDWLLIQNQYRFEIKKGKPLPKGIPLHLIQALKTEKVI